MAFGLQQSYVGNQVTGLAGLGGGSATQWIDPRTGQLLRQPDPLNPAEVHAAQQAAQEFQDAQAMKQWREQMTFMEKTEGAGQIDPEPIINKGTEELSESQRADTRGLRRALAASGGAGAKGGAGEMSGLASLGSRYAGMRQNLARDTRIQTDAFNASNRERERQMKMDLMGRKPMPRAPEIYNPFANARWSLSGGGGGLGTNAYRPPKWVKGDSGVAPGAPGGGFTGGTRIIGTSDTQNRRRTAAATAGLAGLGGGGGFSFA